MAEYVDQLTLGRELVKKYKMRTCGHDQLFDVPPVRRAVCGVGRPGRAHE